MKLRLVLAGVLAVGTLSVARVEAQSQPGPPATQATPSVQQALGAVNSDLVYTPITPCRILDTRNAGGAYTAGQTRSYSLAGSGNYSAYGGNASGCGIPSYVGSNTMPGAYALNFTVVSASGSGFVTAWQFGATKPLASTINWSSSGLVLANSTIVPSGNFLANDISIFAAAPTDLIVDVLGYFIAPEPTALDVVDTANTTVTAIPAGGTADAVAPACPVGYSQTATNGEASTWLMPFVFIHAGTVSARNNDTTPQELRASRTCARTKGKAHA